MTTRLFAALLVYHDDTPHSAAMNMSIDEALVEHAAVPSIRFYRWHSPALSFGYFGRFADVASYTRERDLVRRWTGGGIVLHGDDLTYSIVIPVSDAAFSESSISIYEKIHRALADAFIANGARAELVSVAALCERRKARKGDLQIAPAVGNRRSLWSAIAERRYRNTAITDRGYNCFANPVRADVIIDGRKVAGAAQRRTRCGLLQQGSIQGVAELAKGEHLLQWVSAGKSANSSKSSWATQPVETTGCPSGAKRVDLGNGLADRFARALSTNCKLRSLPETIHDQALEIAARRYGTEAWLRKR